MNDETSFMRPFRYTAAETSPDSRNRHA